MSDTISNNPNRLSSVAAANRTTLEKVAKKNPNPLLHPPAKPRRPHASQKAIP